MNRRALGHCRVLVCLIFAFLIAFSLLVSSRAEKVEQLKPRGYVNDFAGVLDSQAEAQLTALCKEVDQKTRAQIAVVTIRSLEGASVEEFSHRLAVRWGVGYKGDNRGVLILLAISDRRYRIEVGYGLEPILPDGKVGGFGRETVPLLRQAEYSKALALVTGRIAGVIAADRGVMLTSRPEIYLPAPAPAPAPTAPPRSWQEEIAVIVFLVAGFASSYWLFKASWCMVSATFRWIFGGQPARREGWWSLWTDCCRNPWLFRGGDGGDGGWWGGGDGGFGGGDFGGGGASGSW